MRSLVHLNPLRMLPHIVWVLLTFFFLSFSVNIFNRFGWWDRIATDQKIQGYNCSNWNCRTKVKLFLNYRDQPLKLPYPFFIPKSRGILSGFLCCLIHPRNTFHFSTSIFHSFPTFLALSSFSTQAYPYSLSSFFFGSFPCFYPCKNSCLRFERERNHYQATLYWSANGSE